MDGKGDLITVCHSILASWRKHFSQLFNVYRVTEVRQTEIHTAEPLVPEPSAFEVKMGIEILKRLKSSGNYQISAELINVGDRTYCYEIHNLTNYICNAE
jgi:hypothetical protein